MNDLARLHVVIADDNENMQMIVSTLLRAAGLRRLTFCNNGYEAIRVMCRSRVDIAIVDYNMRPVNGIEFTRFIRVSPLSPDPNVPILMMTGHAERGRVLSAQKAGVNEFIVKPVTARQILSRINSILSAPRKVVLPEAGPYRANGTAG